MSDEGNVNVNEKTNSFLDRLKAGHLKSWVLVCIPVILLLSGAMLRNCPSSNDSFAGNSTRTQPSKLVYRTIVFDKYIVAGNAYMEKNGDIQRHLSKGVVFYVNGEADVAFDLSQFNLEDDGSLSYVGEKVEGVTEVLPYTIDVRLPEGNIHRVYEISPTPITPGEAKKLGVAVGSVCAVAGGYLGIKGGGLIGSATQIFSMGSLPFADTIGSLVGGALGAAGGGTAGYLMCGKYLTGAQLAAELTESEEQRIVVQARSLIAAELLHDTSLQKEFTAAFVKYVGDYYRRFGKTIKTDSTFIKIKLAATQPKNS